MSQLRQVQPGFFTDAPVRATAGALVDAPVGEVFKLVAADPSAWAQWCLGFSAASRWTSPPPYGLGSNRTMRAFGATFEETIIAWEENRRFAFRVDTTGVPSVRAFAEDWRFEPAGAGQTRIDWTMAADAGAPKAWLRACLTVGMRLLLRVGGRRMARLATTGTS
jgi:hypothetical protein